MNTKKSLMLATCLFGILGFSTVSQAATLYVASNGMDERECGTKTAPCRSINQAINNANEKDKIVVGPGNYTRAVEGNPGNCFCLIRVDKAVRIESTGGAGVTIVDAQGLENNTVRITANGARFGKKGKGFLLTGAVQTGLSISSLSYSEVRMEGNRAQGNGQAGFKIQGDDHILANNEAVENGTIGFQILGGTNITVKGNVASGNGEAGFDLAGHDSIITKNVATGNAAEGFVIGSAVLVDGGSGHQFERNLAVANTGPGVSVNIAEGVVITDNSLFANDAAGNNCGLENDSGSPLAAPNNYWGTATGPDIDPADALCETDGSIDAIPFATKPIKVKPGAGR